jgi:hypothetical protein
MIPSFDTSAFYPSSFHNMRALRSRVSKVVLKEKRCNIVATARRRTPPDESFVHSFDLIHHLPMDSLNYFLQEIGGGVYKNYA